MLIRAYKWLELPQHQATDNLSVKLLVEDSQATKVRLRMAILPRYQAVLPAYLKKSDTNRNEGVRDWVSGRAGQRATSRGREAPSAVEQVGGGHQSRHGEG